MVYTSGVYPSTMNIKKDKIIVFSKPLQWKQINLAWNVLGTIYFSFLKMTLPFFTYIVSGQG